MNSLHFLDDQRESGFAGELKASPKDFKVFEIDLDGRVCGKTHQLGDNITAEVKQQDSLCNEEDERPAKRCKPNGSQQSSAERAEELIYFTPDSCEKVLSNLLSSSAREELKAMAEQVLLNHEAVTALYLGEFSSKCDRTSLHKSIKFLYPQAVSDTVNKSQVYVQACDKHAVFSELLGQHEASKFLQFVCVRSREDAALQYDIKGTFDKDLRRRIHHAIDQHYGRFMTAKTRPTKNSTCVINVRVRRRNCHGEDKQQYCKFALHKENTETYDAIHKLSRCFHLRQHQFSYAGLKDKKADTWQYMTVEGISVARFLALTSTLPERLHVSDVMPTSSPLHRGDLKGNRFIVVVRNVRPFHRNSSLRAEPDRLATLEERTHLKREVETAINKVQTRGFPNYFGPQRFGRRMPSGSRGSGAQADQVEWEASSIGRAILRRDFKLAIDILLAPNLELPAESATSVEKAKLYLHKSGDIDGALRMMPRYRSREIGILRSLRRFGTNMKSLVGSDEHRVGSEHPDKSKSSAFNSSAKSDGVTATSTESTSSPEITNCADITMDEAIARGELAIPADISSDVATASAPPEFENRKSIDRQTDSSRGSPGMTSSVDDSSRTDGQRPYVKALMSLPHSTLSLYAHAYCSLVWNRLANERLRCHGYRVVEGDYVAAKNEEMSREQIHVVTAEDVTLARFEPRDLILPLPGYKSSYPVHLEQLYQHILDSDDIPLPSDSSMGGAFRVNQLKMNLPGANRKLIEYPSGLDFRWLPDQGRSDAMQETDPTDSSSAIGRFSRKSHVVSSENLDCGDPKIVGSRTDADTCDASRNRSRRARSDEYGHSPGSESEAEPKLEGSKPGELMDIDESPADQTVMTSDAAKTEPDTNEDQLVRASNPTVEVSNSDEVIELGRSRGNGDDDELHLQFEFDLTSSCYATSLLREISMGGIGG